MIWYKSLKIKSIVYTLLVMLVPLILLGAAGTVYYRNVLQHNIQNNGLEQARTFAQLTDNYMGKATLFLEGKAQSAGLIDALRQKDGAGLKGQIRQFNQTTGIFYWMFVTDPDGTVLASSPYGDFEGTDLAGSQIVTEPLRLEKTFINNPVTSDVSGKPSIFMSAPIRIDGRIAGVLVGAVDDNHYRDVIRRTEAGLPLEYTYIVNSTGRIIIHNNREYMTSIKDFSSVPVVTEVIHGREGVLEYDDPIDGGRWLSAFTTLPSGNGGVVVGLPVDEAYRPVNEAVRMLLAGLLLFTMAAGIVAVIVGNYITRPIEKMGIAARQMGKETDVSRYLPYDRGDELGRLAEDFGAMSERILATRDSILKAKNFTDIHLDVLGHDINNLNQVIMADLELLQQYDNLNEVQEEYVRGALEATRESAGLIRNVKAIQTVALEGGEIERIDLDDVLQSCIRETRQPEGKKIAIDYRQEPGKYVRVMPAIGLAFCNIVENAFKYSGREVSIAIAISETLKDNIRYYVTTIEDNGNGIPDNVKETLFRPFQAETTTPPSRGLGLFTAKVIVERFSGWLKIEDRVPGDHRQGTRITLALPAATDKEV